ncbi:MAG: hypothetical protein ACREYC_19200 [Gammaproteobacteria bacterium]
MPESKEQGIPWNLIIPAIALVAVFAAWFLLRKTRAILGGVEVR